MQHCATQSCTKTVNGDFSSWCDAHQPKWDESTKSRNQTERNIFACGDSNAHVFKVIGDTCPFLNVHDEICPGSSAKGLANKKSKSKVNERIGEMLSDYCNNKGKPDLFLLMFGSVDLDYVLMYKWVVARKPVLPKDQLQNSISGIERFLKSTVLPKIDGERQRVCLVGVQPPICTADLIPIANRPSDVDVKFPNYKERLSWTRFYNASLKDLAWREGYQYFDCVEQLLDEKGELLHTNFRNKDRILDNHLDEAKTWSIYLQKILGLRYREEPDATKLLDSEARLCACTAGTDDGHDFVMVDENKCQEVQTPMSRSPTLSGDELDEPELDEGPRVNIIQKQPRQQQSRDVLTRAWNSRPEGSDFTPRAHTRPAKPRPPVERGRERPRRARTLINIFVHGNWSNRFSKKGRQQRERARDLRYPRVVWNRNPRAARHRTELLL